MVDNQSNTDELEICADLPSEFFEKIGITETKPKLSDGGTSQGYGPCVASVEGTPEAMEIDFLKAISLSPSLIQASNISIAETSSGDSIFLEASEDGSLKGCFATIQTVKGVLSLRYFPSHGKSAVEVCPDAEHWMRVLLTADSKDTYTG